MSDLVFYGVGVGLVLTIVYLVTTWNGFVRARNKVDESWSGIDVQLKRRHDLVPNLVKTVKGYADHERGTLTEVTEARTRAMSAGTRGERASAEGALTTALGNVNALAEQSPQLRAADSFQQLQAELSGLESEIQAARRIYNANVQSYNSRIQVFPNSLLASSSFEPREFFELDSPSERAVPAVSFA
jgi:LemA protein